MGVGELRFVLTYYSLLLLLSARSETRTAASPGGANDCRLRGARLLTTTTQLLFSSWVNCRSHHHTLPVGVGGSHDQKTLRSPFAANSTVSVGGSALPYDFRWVGLHMPSSPEQEIVCPWIHACRMHIPNHPAQITSYIVISFARTSSSLDLLEICWKGLLLGVTIARLAEIRRTCRPCKGAYHVNFADQALRAISMQRRHNVEL